MYNPDKSNQGGDPVNRPTTSEDTVGEALLMVRPLNLTPRTGQDLASDEGEIPIALSLPSRRSPAILGSDPFQFEPPASAALQETATPDSIKWGDARREVCLGPPRQATSSGPATPFSSARQPTRAGPSNPFRAGPANTTPDHEDGDWETIFGDGNTGKYQKPDYRMRRQYDNGESDDDDDYSRRWGGRRAPAEARPLSPLFPGVPVDTRFPLFGSETMKSPALPNRRLVFGEEEGRPVFRPEQRVHRVNGHLIGEEDESGNATTTTVTTTMTPSQSSRSRPGCIPGQYYEGDDEFSTTEFEDIPLGAGGGNDTTTSSRHLHLELSNPVPRPVQLKPTRPLPLHLDQLENQAPAQQQQQQQESRGWLGRAYNYVARIPAAPRNVLFSSADAPRDAFTGDGRIRPGDARRARLADDGRAGRAGRARLAEFSTRESFSETRQDFSGGRGGHSGARDGYSRGPDGCSGGRDDHSGGRDGRSRGPDGHSGGPHGHSGARNGHSRGPCGYSNARDEHSGGRGEHSETRGERQAGRGKETGGRVKETFGREGVKVRPGRPGNIFDSISDTHPMAEEDVRACQLAFDMTAAEFSEARRKAQQVRQQAMGRREQDVDTSMEHVYAPAQVGESSLEFDSSQITASSFELQDSSPVQPLPHDNWIQHAQSSIGPATNNHLSDLDSYFASVSTSQILPTISPAAARPTSPLSPDAHFHRLIALHSLQRNDGPNHPNPAATDSYNLNLSFRLPNPEPVLYNPRPNCTPAAHLSTLTPTAPARHRVGIARTTRAPFHPPPSPSASRTALSPAELQSRRGGVARLPSTRHVRSQRNITPLLLAQRASQAVGRSLRGRALGHEEGIELRELRRGGGGGFFVLGDDVEGQQQQVGQSSSNMNRWWARVVLV